MKKITVAIFFLFLSFFSPTIYAQTQTGYCPYDPKIVPPKNLGEFSRVFETLIAEVGTGNAFYISVGTTSVTGSGTTGRVGTSTATDLSLPMFGWDGARWVFKPAGTTTFQEIGNVQTGSMSGYVTSNGGTLTSGNLAGTTTITSGGIFSTNGRTITDVEVSYLDNLTDFLPTLLDAKVTNNGSSTYITSVEADGKTGTRAARLIQGANMAITSTLAQGGILDITLSPTGSASAKPTTMEAGATVTAASDFFDYDADDFDPVGSSTGTRIKLSTAQKGTSTPVAANTVVRSDANGKIKADWLDVSAWAYRTQSLSVTNGTWTHIPLGDGHILASVTHSLTSNPERFVADIAGTYTVESEVQFRGNDFACMTRFVINDLIEATGTARHKYANVGDGNTGGVLSSLGRVYLNAGDYIGLQIAHNASGARTMLDAYYTAAGLPAIGTSTMASVRMKLE